MPSEWQPIETAPKDQARILLVAVGTVMIGHWERRLLRFRIEGGHHSWLLGKITHWMPLPEPPPILDKAE
jgi:hypothetical protein